jgi:hypothetical protein
MKTPFDEMPSGFWKTKTGELMLPSEMHDGHLCNTIRFIERSIVVSMQMILSTYMSVPEPNGEMAAMAFNSEFDMLLEADWHDYLPKIYWTMKNEVKKRNLDDPSYTDSQIQAFELTASAVMLNNMLGRRQ